jgi:hypothetical protein
MGYCTCTIITLILLTNLAWAPSGPNPDDEPEMEVCRGL